MVCGTTTDIVTDHIYIHSIRQAHECRYTDIQIHKINKNVLLISGPDLYLFQPIIDQTIY